MPDALIFEDDPMVGDLAAEVLRRKGLTVDHFLSGAGAVQMVKDRRPRLVVLDIMMPGMDGLSACRAIRSDPATGHVKIIILTAKDSKRDRESAERYGADLYLNKPFDSGEFARSAGRLLGFPADPDLESIPRPPAPPVALSWLGGGAVIETASWWVLCDSGRGVGRWIESRAKPPRGCWLLLSRFQEEAHLEIEGCGTLLATGCTVKIAAPEEPEGLLQRLAPRMCRGLPPGKATPLLLPRSEGEFPLDSGMRAACRYTQHPGTTLAYRLDMHGRGIVYCPAHEIKDDPESWQGHETGKFRSFFSKADILLHGYRRSSSEARPEDERGAGAWEPVVKLACEARVKRLALFPLPGAVGVPDLEAKMRELVVHRGGALDCCALVPGQRFVL